MNSDRKGNLTTWLGLDCSTGSKKGSGTGWALVRAGNTLVRRDSGVWRPGDHKDPVARRIDDIACDIAMWQYKPEHQFRFIAYEGGFARNGQAAIKLGQVRGAVLQALGTQQAIEIAPTEIKRLVTGSGKATKGQIAFWVGGLLGIDTSDMPDDETDALAVAIAAATLYQRSE